MKIETIVIDFVELSCALAVDKETTCERLVERSSEVKFSLGWRRPACLIAPDYIIVPFFVEMLEENDFVRFKEAENFRDYIETLTYVV